MTARTSSMRSSSVAIPQSRSVKPVLAQCFHGNFDQVVWCMRRILTLDRDVAAELARQRRLRGGGLPALINNALRRGVTELLAEDAQRRRPSRRRLRPAAR